MLRELVRSTERVSVRVWSAYFMLTLDAKLAIKTLQDVGRTTQSATLGITCDTTLDEWKAGRLDVDWFLKQK